MGDGQDHTAKTKEGGEVGGTGNSAAVDPPLLASVNEGQAAVDAELLRKFKTIQQLDLTISPMEPTLRLHPRKIPADQEATHTGGFDTNVTVERFVGRKYGDLVVAQALERKDELGISSLAEFRLSRHMHSGRPRKTYCYKCRFFLELSYLARPWLMPLQTESKMLWYNESDLDSEEDEQVRKGIQKERGLEWAQKNMKGAMKETRRSPRKKPKTDDMETWNCISNVE